MAFLIYLTVLTTAVIAQVRLKPGWARAAVAGSGNGVSIKTET